MSQKYIEHITILDSIPGGGKTTYMSEYMKNNKDDYNFIYITPFLNEVARIEKDVKGFVSPKHKGVGKLNSIKELMINYNNISATHSLFSYVDEEFVDILKHNRYILVLDEVMDVLEQLPMKRDDVEIFINNGYFTIQDDNTVVYTGEEDYKGVFKDVVEIIKRGNKSGLNRVIIDSEMRLLFWKFPVEVFKHFEKVFILTYMFDGQIMKYYYDTHGVKYKKIGVGGDYNEDEEWKGFYLKDYDPEEHLNKNLKINILEDSKLNSIGSKTKTALSYSWYSKNSKKKMLFTQLKNNLSNYFINKIEDSLIDNFFWTTFKEHKDMFGRRFNSSFVPCTMRATNDYRNRHNIAYLINRYMNPNIKRYFERRNVVVNQEDYALSEMIQFIWRSAIRDGDEINIYIPSIRMRNLLKNWLQE